MSVSAVCSRVFTATETRLLAVAAAALNTLVVVAKVPVASATKGAIASPSYVVSSCVATDRSVSVYQLFPNDGKDND